MGVGEGRGGGEGEWVQDAVRDAGSESACCAVTNNQGRGSAGRPASCKPESPGGTHESGWRQFVSMFTFQLHISPNFFEPRTQA